MLEELKEFERIQKSVVLSVEKLSCTAYGRDILVTKSIPPKSPFLRRSPVKEKAGSEGIFEKDNRDQPKVWKIRPGQTKLTPFVYSS